MVLGKRKSPFIGVTESQDTPILYSRYTDVSELLLEPVKGGSDVLTAEQEAPVENSKKKPKREKSETKTAAQAEQAPPSIVKEEEIKKKPKTEKLRKPTQSEDATPVELNKEERAEVEANGAAVAGEGLKEGEDGQPESKAAKKKNKKARAKARAAAAAASGPGNAAEAQQIRSIMGIAPAGEAQKSQPFGTFSFGFAAASAANGEAAAPPISEHETGDEPVAEDVEPPKSQGNTESDARLRRVLGQDASHVPRRVFVGGMPFSYDEEEVREYWSYCGEIEDMDLMRFPDTNRFKGIAFITFADDAGYREALKCDGTMIDEVKIKVEPCMSDGPKGGKKARLVRSKDWSQHTSPAPKTPGYHVAYVGNVDFNANQDQLRGVFEGCEVTVVRLHTDKDTGKSKGYAHVHFADEDSLDRAMEFSGTKLMGRSIKVGYAQPKK